MKKKIIIALAFASTLMVRAEQTLLEKLQTATLKYVEERSKLETDRALMQQKLEELDRKQQEAKKQDKMSILLIMKQTKEQLNQLDAQIKTLQNDYETLKRTLTPY